MSNEIKASYLMAGVPPYFLEFADAMIRADHAPVEARASGVEHT
jgi:hypothetical protein